MDFQRLIAFINVLNIGLSASYIPTVIFQIMWYELSPFTLMACALSWLQTLTINPLFDEYLEKFVDKYIKRK